MVRRVFILTQNTPDYGRFLNLMIELEQSVTAVVEKYFLPMEPL